MTTAPEWRIWTEISQKYDLRFIQLPDDLLAKLAKEGEQERGIIPAGLYRGVDRPIPTAVRTGTAVYGRRYAGPFCISRCEGDGRTPGPSTMAASELLL
jgi:hypothetical protein